MARNAAEIQADISLTREQIETELDTLERPVRLLWSAAPLAILALGLGIGIFGSRVAIIRGARTAWRLWWTGMAFKTTLAVADALVRAAGRRS